MKKRKVYFPVLCTLWVVCPTYAILLACFTTDIVDQVCTPWGIHNSVAAQKAVPALMISVEYFLPLALMIIWYSCIVYTLRTKVNSPTLQSVMCLFKQHGHKVERRIDRQ